MSLRGSPKPVVGLNALSESYCDGELELNLKAEQPDADWFTQKNNFTQSKVGRFCVGYNHSKPSTLMSAKIYLVDEDRMVMDPSQVYDSLPQSIKYSIKGINELRALS